MRWDTQAWAKLLILEMLQHATAISWRRAGALICKALKLSWLQGPLDSPGNGSAPTKQKAACGLHPACARLLQAANSVADLEANNVVILS